MFTALIVEDEPLMRDYLMLNLTSIHKKWKTTGCAKNGIEALSLLKNCHYDLIITDIKMPQMDGLELATYVHNHLPDTNVIILTGHDEFNYARTAVRAGVSDYLLKPLQDMELHQILDKLAAQKEKQQGNVPEVQVAVSEAFTSAQDFSQNSGTLSTESSSIPAPRTPESSGLPIQRTPESSNILVRRAREYIQAHFSEAISLNDVADTLNVNAAYLSSIFKSAQGESYSKYLLRLRMERATLLLSTHSVGKVCDIAAEVGYPSAKHFDTVFKKYYGITPNEYRNRANHN